MSHGRQTCPRCHHPDCISGTADFQALCAQRVAENERVDRLMLRRRGEPDATCDEPVDEVTMLRAVNARLVDRIAVLERALGAKFDEKLGELARESEQA